MSRRRPLPYLPYRPVPRNIREAWPRLRFQVSGLGLVPSLEASRCSVSSSEVPGRRRGGGPLDSRRPRISLKPPTTGGLTREGRALTGWPVILSDFRAQDGYHRPLLLVSVRRVAVLNARVMSECAEARKIRLSISYVRQRLWWRSRDSSSKPLGRERRCSARPDCVRRPREFCHVVVASERP